MPQTGKVGTTATIISTTDGQTQVVYHSTPVVTFNRLTVVLQARGWLTVTTKLRMNQASNQFGLSFLVYQEKFRWYVKLPDGTEVAFREGMSFPRA